jgi:conjugative element/phage-associated large polyvalent protein
MSGQDDSARGAPASGPAPRLKRAMGRIEQVLRERGIPAPGAGPIERPPGVEALDAAAERIRELQRNLRLTYAINAGVYADPNWPTKAIFHDQGKAIVTADSSQRTVAAMVDVAEIKGWTKLQLSGSKEFQREAWIEATSRGMAVQTRGYTPTQQDREEAQNRSTVQTLAAPKNKIEQGQVPRTSAEARVERGRDAPRRAAPAQAAKVSRPADAGEGAVARERAARLAAQTQASSVQARDSADHLDRTAWRSAERVDARSDAAQAELAADRVEGIVTTTAAATATRGRGQEAMAKTEQEGNSCARAAENLARYAAADEMMDRLSDDPKRWPPVIAALEEYLKSTRLSAAKRAQVREIAFGYFSQEQGAARTAAVALLDPDAPALRPPPQVGSRTHEPEQQRVR